MRRRAEFYYQQFDALRWLRQEVRRELLAESGKRSVSKLPRQIPSIDPLRAVLLIALLQTPHRFRTKRQLRSYIGLGIETHSSAEHRYADGQLQRSKKQISIRGLNRNHDLKNLFKSAATIAAAKAEPFAVHPGVGSKERHEDRVDQRSGGASHRVGWDETGAGEVACSAGQ